MVRFSRFLSATRRYRPTVFTMLSDHDVTITSAVHFVFKLIGSNFSLGIITSQMHNKESNCTFCVLVRSVVLNRRLKQIYQGVSKIIFSHVKRKI